MPEIQPLSLAELRKKAMRLPQTPGVYLMKNRQGTIIYIGKAKALKNRVSQYFGSHRNHGIKVIRMGLHASKEVESAMLGGVYHPAFREICESRIFFEDAAALLSQRERGSYILYTDPRSISRAVGQKRSNISAFARLGYDVTVKPLSGEYMKICEKPGR